MLEPRLSREIGIQRHFIARSRDIPARQVVPVGWTSRLIPACWKVLCLLSRPSPAPL